MQPSGNKILPESEYYIYIASIEAKETLFYPTFVGHFFYEKDYRLSRLMYDNFLLVLVEEGSMQLELDGKYVKATKGQVILLDCFTYHAYFTTEACEAKWVYFNGSSAKKYYDMIIRRNGNVIRPKNVNQISDILDEMCKTLREKHCLSEAKISEKIVQMLTELICSHQLNEKQQELCNKMNEVVSYILSHYKEDIMLEDMAERANLSPYYFTRVFKTVTGYTPHEYLLITRMNAAKFLLHDTKASVKETCFSVGFTNESNFCTSFKKIIGVTPSEYKNDKACDCKLKNK